MRTSIEFTDDFGYGILVNDLKPPADRFRNWVPVSDPVGPLRHALGTGIPAMWEFRSDYGAKFSLYEIRDAEQVTMARLKRHLKRGGQITVNTGDYYDSIYECYLYPGSDVDIAGWDAKNRKRILTLTVLNSQPVDMFCIYGAGTNNITGSPPW